MRREPARRGAGVLRRGQARARRRRFRAPRRGTADFGDARLGDDLFQPLQHEVPLLPELPDQPVRERAGDGHGNAGGGDASAPGAGGSQRQLRHPHPARAADAGGGSPGSRKGVRPPGGLQHERVRRARNARAPRRRRRHLPAGREISFRGACGDGFRNPRLRAAQRSRHRRDGAPGRVPLPPGTTGSPRGGSSSAISSFREEWGRRRRCWRICRKGTVRSFPCP